MHVLRYNRFFPFSLNPKTTSQFLLNLMNPTLSESFIYVSKTVKIAFNAQAFLAGCVILSEKSRANTISLFFLLTVLSNNLAMLGASDKRAFDYSLKLIFFRFLILKMAYNAFQGLFCVLTSNISLRCSRHFLLISGS